MVFRVQRFVGLPQGNLQLLQLLFVPALLLLALFLASLIKPVTVVPRPSATLRIVCRVTFRSPRSMELK